MSQIKVTITDETGGTDSVSSSSSTPSNTTINKKNGSIKSKEVKKSQDDSKALAVASMIGSQAFNYMTSNVGKWTGSSAKQQQVNNAMQLVSIGAMAYVSPAIAIANVGINLATTAMDTAYEQRWDSYSKEQARKRAGELKGRGR
jgi:hypothetical protein